MPAVPSLEPVPELVPPHIISQATCASSPGQEVTFDDRIEVQLSPE